MTRRVFDGILYATLSDFADAARVHLKRGRSVLRFRWDYIDEGSVSGPRKHIEENARYVRENGG